MTFTDTTRPVLATVRAADPMTVAAAAGVLLGVLDTVFLQVLPYPQAGLLHSGVVWAAAAIGIGAWVGPQRTGAGRAAVVLLLAALASYDVLRVLTADSGTLVAPMAVVWLVVAVVVGPWLGEIGALARAGRLQSGQVIRLGGLLLAYLLLPTVLETALRAGQTALSIGLVR